VASIHVVIQLEVAARIVAPPGRRDYGYLSAACQFYTKPEIVFRIPAGAFRPPPKVTSALVRMELPGERTRLAINQEEKFLEFIQACFGQKRKTLRNNLRSKLGVEEAEAALKSVGVNLHTRAEELSLAEFANLYRATRGSEEPEPRHP
jgi:16S rRNA (adenine1518-N6/adenine1519-N6)-dimethyltransferase